MSLGREEGAEELGPWTVFLGTGRQEDLRSWDYGPCSLEQGESRIEEPSWPAWQGWCTQVGVVQRHSAILPFHWAGMGERHKSPSLS